jgi:hypothetical protein
LKFVFKNSGFQWLEVRKKGLKNHQISEFGLPYVAKTMEG